MNILTLDRSKLAEEISLIYHSTVMFSSCIVGIITCKIMI